MLKLYNTLKRQKEKFKPIKKGKVGIYTCGPTVYNYAHIGNLRSYVFADILNRVLKYNGYKVKHIVNITDIGHLVSDADEGEDKMTRALKREGLNLSKKSMLALAHKYTLAFKHDLQTLNIIIPDKWASATAHIKEQIRLIKKLEKNGFTYKTSDGLYFDSSRLKNYGELARLDVTGLEAGKRVAAGEKKNKTDFALWKFSGKQKRLMDWLSPWGRGFPGWHIECSAMSIKYLGRQFDIHTGGVDHIPIHHTNERAQNIGTFGGPVARFWLHNEWVIMKSGEKMAKSADNFLTLESLKKRGFSPLAYRYFLLNAHYRSPVEFSFPALRGADAALDNLYKKIRELNNNIAETRRRSAPTARNHEQKFLTAVNDDLNTPRALAVVWDILKDEGLPAKDKNKLLFKFDKVLGLNLKKEAEKKINIPREVKKLLEERERARLNKNWRKSDNLRQRIKALGFTVEDTPQGQKIKKIIS